MAEKDMSGLAVERVVRMIGELRGHLATQLPYGPKKEKLTAREARRRLQNMPPAQKMDMEKRMGPEEWEIYMEKLYRG